MNDLPNLEHRVAELERQLATSDRESARGAGRFLWPLLLGVLVLGQLTLLVVSWQTQRQAHAEHQFWILCQPGGSVTSRTEAFLALVREGNSEWRSAQLDHLELQQAVLDEADLQFASFEASQMQGASLIQANLARTDLQLVDLSEADLRDAELTEANLLRAKLLDARLERARLTGANLQQVEAQRAELGRADLADAKLLMADLREANLVGANLTDAVLDGALLRNADLTQANLAGATFDHVDLSGSNWWQARGLRPGQLLDFADRFSPDQDASRVKRESFQKWEEDVLIELTEASDP